MIKAEDIINEQVKNFAAELRKAGIHTVKVRWDKLSRQFKFSGPVDDVKRAEDVIRKLSK